MLRRRRWTLDNDVAPGGRRCEVMRETVDTGVADADTLALGDIARIDLRRFFEGDGAEFGWVTFVSPGDRP